ncbi:MAG: ParB N-terminal domain-containing protein [Solirubrobacterales bacterium]|nr:ParB N-terminal domain-containing protein [Solirubrobacterales bacterium]
MNATAILTPEHVHIDLIDVDDANVRELDQAHVDALAGSITLRGLINPITLRPNGERFTLVAGYHRLAACRKLGIKEIPASSREQDATSADTAAENILRKGLSPLEPGTMALDASFGVLGGWDRALLWPMSCRRRAPARSRDSLAMAGFRLSPLDQMQHCCGEYATLWV